MKIVLVVVVALFGCRSDKANTPPAASRPNETVAKDDPWAAEGPAQNTDPKQSMGAGGTARFDLRDRAGWRLVGNHSGAITLTNESGGVLQGFPFVKRPTDAQLQKLFAGATLTGSDDVRALEVNTALGPNRGWFRVMACDDQFLVLVYVEKGAGGSTNRETLANAKCLAKDVPDVAWPLS